jgi:enoyl-CoA hydratase
MLENVLYEKKGAIATVTVNRPKVLNALNTPTWTDLRTAFEDARDDAAVLGVILTGAGDKAFIAGADIGELAHAPRSTPNSRAASARVCLSSSRISASR